MANWSNPTLASLRTNVLTELKDRDVDSGTLYVSSPTNPVTGAFRFNRSTLLFEEWDGAAWQVKTLAIAGGGTGATTASAARSALGLGTMATQNSNSVAISGGTIAGLASLGVSGTITGGLFSGSGASLTNIPNSATTATNLNTASAIVARDGSGNFSAGTITATLNGNAATVTNGVVTSGSYSDPAWITSLAATKLTGTIADARLSANVLLASSGIIRLDTQPRSKAYKPGNATIPTGVETALTFATSQFESATSLINEGGDPAISLSSGGAGLYQITIQVTFLSGAGGTIRKVIAYDGAANALARDERLPAAVPMVLRTTFLYYYTGLNSANISAYVYQDSGGNLDVYGADQSNTYIEVCKLW